METRIGPVTRASIPVRVDCIEVDEGLDVLNNDLK